MCYYVVDFVHTVTRIAALLCPQLSISFATSAHKAASHFQSIGGPLFQTVSDREGWQSTICLLGPHTHGDKETQCTPGLFAT